MNSKNDSNKLQVLLMEWARNEQPSPSDLDELTQRVQSSWRAQAATSQPAIANRMHANSSQTRNATHWHFLSAMAAGLIIALGLWRINVQSPMARPLQPTHQLGESIEQQRTSRAKLYANVQSMFEDGVAWIAETEDNMWFDLEPAPSEPGRQLVAVRLEIGKPANELTHSDFKQIWTIDVILKNEQVALVQRGDLTPEVVVWPYLMEDGMMALETTVDLHGDLPRHAQMTTVFSLNATGSAQKSTPIGEYEFRQSIMLLPKPTT